LRSSFHARADQSVLHHPGIQECPDELQQPLVLDALGDLVVMIDSIDREPACRRSTKASWVLRQATRRCPTDLYPAPRKPSPEQIEAVIAYLQARIIGRGEISRAESGAYYEGYNSELCQDYK
jgi:hypothetical protein